MSVHYRALPQSKSITLLKNKLVDVNANVVTLQKKASRNGYSVDVISPEIKQASQEVESLMGDLTQDNQKLFYTTVSAVLFGKDKDELDERTFYLPGEDACNTAGSRAQLMPAIRCK